jgi:diguanylate cyclase (GGDEF)-like protein
MSDWVTLQTWLPAMTGALAYIALAIGAYQLAAASEGGAFQGRIGLVTAALLAGAALELATLAAGAWPFRALSGLTGFVRIVAGGWLLLLPALFWPLAARFRQGQVRVLNRRLLARAERAERAAAIAQNWLQLAEESAHIGHWELTLPDQRLRWSDEVYRIHGLWREHYKPQIASALAALHPLDGKRVGGLLQDAIANGGRFDAAVRLRRPDGEIRHIVLRATAQTGPLGLVDAVTGVILDVTEPRRALPALPGQREPVFEDALTGLADRRAFDMALGYEFKRAVRSHKPLGLVLLAVDGFDALALHHGARERDLRLRAVSQAVQAVPRRTGDVVARFDDTSIAVLLPLADVSGAQRVAAQIAEAIHGLALGHGGRPSGVLTVSCGAAAFAGMDDLYNPLELIRRATHALAEAANNGGDQVMAFWPKLLTETARD